MPKASYIKCKFCEGTGKEVDFFDLPETPLISLTPVEKSPSGRRFTGKGCVVCRGRGKIFTLTT